MKVGRLRPQGSRPEACDAALATASPRCAGPGLAVAPTPRRPRFAAFTMVEVALSIAVVAFALVAIVGVLPSGLQVQRDNREDTIVNQDAAYWLELIRNASTNAYELTNYVESITLRQNSLNPQVFTRSNVTWRGMIGLLSTPKYVPNPFQVLKTTNTVTAVVRAITGSAIEKPPSAADIAFRYQMIPEVTPLIPTPPALTNAMTTNQLAQWASLQRNAYELRLSFRWPVLPNGDVGSRRRTLRAIVSGQLVRDTNANFYFFQPASYR
jgi:type II secretory pathway pseudopilin PulG